MTLAQGFDQRGGDGPPGLPPWLARRQPMNPKLIVVDGEATENEIQVRLPMSVGRVDAGLVIAHPLVSRKHCEIFRRDDWLWIRDFNSANGTYIDDNRVEGEALLKPGDRLTIGPLTFVAVYQQNGLVSPRVNAQAAAKLKKAEARAGVHGPAPKTPKPASKPPAPPAARRDPLEEIMDRLEADGTADPEAVEADPHLLDDAVENEGSLSEGGPPSGYDPDDDEITQDIEPDAQSSEPEMSASEQPASESAAEPFRSDQDALETESGQSFEEDDDSSKTRLCVVSVGKPSAEGPVALGGQPVPRLTDAADAGEGDLPPTRDDALLFHLINQCDQLQRQMLEHYQQAMITAELVNQLQQDQWDLVRVELDRMYDLTSMLQQAIVARHPAIKRVPGGDVFGIELPEALTAPSDQGRHLNSDATQMDMSIEQLHALLRKRVVISQQASQLRWDEIRQFFRANDVG